MSPGGRIVITLALALTPWAQAALAQTAARKASDAAALLRGEQIYARCAACHAIEANRTGPQHCGLFGRRAGTAPGFDTYSKAMRDSKIVWNGGSLEAFLAAPTQAVPGTTMALVGMTSAAERTAIINYLKSAPKR